MCQGCLSCAKNGLCQIVDDFEQVKMKMKDADLIIFGSSVYISHVSATFKNFLDRMFLSMHIFEFAGKPCINVITSNGSGEQETEKYMNHVSLLLGTIRIGTLIRLSNEKFDKKKLLRIADKASKILSQRSMLKPSVMNSIYF